MKRILGLMLMAAAGLFIAATYNVDSDGYQVGDVAKDFKLKNLDGKMVSMADYKDAKGFIVIFTCNTCPYAVQYEDRIIELNTKYAPKGYPVIAIQPNNPAAKPGDSFEAMQQRAKDKGFDFPYLLDEGQKVYPVWGAQRTPHVYLLNKEKVIKYIGAIDNNYRDASAVTEKYVEEAIAAIEKGEEPKVTFTKAIGCTIRA